MQIVLDGYIKASNDPVLEHRINSHQVKVKYLEVHKTIYFPFQY